MLGTFLQVELVILPRSILSDNPQDQQQEQPPQPPPPPPPENQDSSEDQNEEEEDDQEVDLLYCTNIKLAAFFHFFSHRSQLFLWTG